MICLPCKGCGADLGYDQWPWGDPFLPSKPYFRDGAAWCATCYNDCVTWGLPGVHILPGSLDSPVKQAATRDA